MNTDAIPSFDPVQDRAVTRGLLMALSRPRAFFFQASVPTVIVLATLTAGIQPLVKQAERLDRWRRYEWMLYEEFARWLASRTHGDVAIQLAERAKQFGQRRADLMLPAATLGGVTLAGLAFNTSGVAGLLDTIYQPQSLRATAIGFSLVFCLAWLTLLVRLVRQHLRTVAWLGRLNQTLGSVDLRPVQPSPVRLPWIMLMLAAALALIGPVWAGAMVAMIALQNQLVEDARHLKLRLVERVLELTDDSGLPVEFDVTETTPEAFVNARPSAAAGALT